MARRALHWLSSSFWGVAVSLFVVYSATPFRPDSLRRGDGWGREANFLVARTAHGHRTMGRVAGQWRLFVDAPRAEHFSAAPAVRLSNKRKKKIRVKSIYRLIRRVIGRPCGQWAPSFGRQSKFMFQDTSNAWPDFKANCTENIDVWKPISGSFMTHPPPSVALEKKCNEIRRNVIWVLERCFTFLLKWSKGVEQTHSRMLRKLRQSRATESISRRNWPDVSGGSAATRTPLLSSKTESFISVGMAASGWSDTTNRTAFFSRWLSSSSASTSRLSGGDWGFSSSSACAQSFS